MAVAETILPNGVSIAAQGGYFGQYGCYYGSTNWFTFYVHTNVNGSYLPGFLEPMIGTFGDPTQTCSSIQIYTNFNPGTAAADLDDEVDAGVKVHVPSLVQDPVTGNLIAGWQGGSKTGDNNTNVSIRLAFRTNGVWSHWQVMNAGNSPTNYEMGSLGVLNGSVVCFYNISTNGNTNCAVQWRTVSISGGSARFRPGKLPEHH